jgi:Fe2+ transport system protein B
MTTALIPSFGAREVMVSALATVLSVEESEDDEQAFNASIQEKNNFKFLTGHITFSFGVVCLCTTVYLHFCSAQKRDW